MDRAPAGNGAAVRRTFGALGALTVEDARHATRELLDGIGPEPDLPERSPLPDRDVRRLNDLERRVAELEEGRAARARVFRPGFRPRS